jgi:predicted DNA-binding transcriptional regulator YafY
MQFYKNMRQLEQLDNMIRKGATGAPKQLAERMHISERQLYRIIDDLKNIGFPIEYSAEQSRYYYTEEVKLTIDITIGDVNVIKIKNN